MADAVASACVDRLEPGLSALESDLESEDARRPVPAGVGFQGLAAGVASWHQPVPGRLDRRPFPFGVDAEHLARVAQFAFYLAHTFAAVEQRVGNDVQ